MSRASVTPPRGVRFCHEDTIIPTVLGQAPRSTPTPSPTLSTSTLESPPLSSPLSLSPHRLPLTVGVANNGDATASPTSCARLPSPTSPTSPNGAGFGLGGGAPCIALDPALQVPGATKLPPFVWDMMRDPQGPHAIVPVLPRATLERPAVTPPLEQMTIAVMPLSDVHPPWPVAITPSSSPYVTVRDVLQGLFVDLQIGLAPENWRVAGEAQARIRLAAERRVERMRKKGDERRDRPEHGRKRLDLLLERYRFGGLLYNPKLQMWELKLEEHS
ncbi:hypothetical protein D9611_011137 [Ephemerocybe angulata]|uniref:DUF6699 domain-containing protein n=1 Tax=Ephemerocybe angulata TaxID=980116 RepID=A0A8H5CC76_9AGAR|nr:hypothetical protein D9611_011137 [Tulosesus angulatus]